MLVEIRKVAKTYRGSSQSVRALEDVSFSVDSGQFFAVEGPSGCGKTTLLLIAGGLLAPDAGDVLIDGDNPYGMSADRRARFRAAKIGFVFQQFHLVPYLTVLDNVLAPTIAARAPGAAERARELIARFGLEHRMHHVPSELSTGERQRTALARALLNRPKLLLADEPTGNLDRENGEAVLGYLADFVSDGGAVLLVTHDALAVQQAGHVLRMRNGRLLEAETSVR
jgi:ABC-type lipoprotein export system ATPase subunit